MDETKTATEHPAGATQNSAPNSRLPTATSDHFFIVKCFTHVYVTTVASRFTAVVKPSAATRFVLARARFDQ